MLRILLALMAILLLASSCGSSNIAQLGDSSRETSVTNATTAWDSVCAEYHFVPKPNDPAITFSQGYYGSNFILDFTLITMRVNLMVGLLNVQQPTTGSDVMKSRIENWGLLGGGGLI